MPSSGSPSLIRRFGAVHRWVGLLGLVGLFGSTAARAQHGDHAASFPTSLATLAEGAAIISDLGVWHREVVASAEAQAYFDQGLRLVYGFNHDEAARSFAKAAVLSPGCAMCFWGIALSLGPNYNVPMQPDRAKLAWDALKKARSLASRPIDKALVGALSDRYAGPELPADQSRYDAAYADAMRKVAASDAADVDVQVLFAEALMDVRPWRLWTAEGAPAPDTLELVATLERALLASPSHPGACIRAR